MSWLFTGSIGASKKRLKEVSELAAQIDEHRQLLLANLLFGIADPKAYSAVDLQHRRSMLLLLRRDERPADDWLLAAKNKLAALLSSHEYDLGDLREQRAIAREEKKAQAKQRFRVEKDARLVQALREATRAQSDAAKQMACKKLAAIVTDLVREDAIVTSLEGRADLRELGVHAEGAAVTYGRIEKW